MPDVFIETTLPCCLSTCKRECGSTFGGALRSKWFLILQRLEQMAQDVLVTFVLDGDFWVWQNFFWDRQWLSKHPVVQTLYSFAEVGVDVRGVDSFKRQVFGVHHRPTAIDEMERYVKFRKRLAELGSVDYLLCGDLYASVRPNASTACRTDLSLHVDALHAVTLDKQAFDNSKYHMLWLAKAYS
jgi:hypothetical protein